MEWITILGFLAGACTTAGYVPQLIKALRTKSTRDISLLMFLVISTGVFLWFIYGIYLNSLPIIVANGATLVLTMTIAFLKFKYSRRLGEIP